MEFYLFDVYSMVLNLFKKTTKINRFGGKKYFNISYTLWFYGIIGTIVVNHEFECPIESKWTDHFDNAFFLAFLIIQKTRFVCSNIVYLSFLQLTNIKTRFRSIEFIPQLCQRIKVHFHTQPDIFSNTNFFRFLYNY